MQGQVSWVLETTVKPGQLDTFKALMDEMAEGSSTEPHTLNYEWYISDDGGTIHLYEKYADSDAMIAHLGGFLEKWAPRFMSSIDPTRFTVYGDPSHEAREMLAAFAPTYLAPWGGFARSSTA
jgi:quinol monooxygenase YgiN